MKKIIVVLFVFAVLISGITYAARRRSQGTDTFQIVTSFYPLYYFTQSIAGTLLKVVNITPAGAEPHDYEPSTGDIVQMEQSRLIILNGGHLEAWGDKVAENLKGTATKILTVGDVLASHTVTENGKTDTDPHVWLDPVLAKQEAHAIMLGLSATDPSHATDYQAGERALDSRLDTLDLNYRTGLRNCVRKDIVTSHAAFGYLAGEYGLNQVAIAGLSPDAEPSISQLASLAAYVKEHQVKAIFFESLASPKLSNTLSTETGVKTMELNPLEGLTAEQIRQGDNYFSVMQKNLRTLRNALDC
jgi:zinc transport system substrate-binding protein